MGRWRRHGRRHPHAAGSQAQGIHRAHRAATARGQGLRHPHRVGPDFRVSRRRFPRRCRGARGEAHCRLVLQRLAGRSAGRHGRRPHAGFAHAGSAGKTHCKRQGKSKGKRRQVMLEALVSATLRTLLLALLVELCLRILRVRHPQLLLAAWTAVLMASLAMPILQRYALVTVPIAVDLPVSFAELPGGESPAMDAVGVNGATAAAPVAVHSAPAWRLWLMGGYLIVAGAMLARLLM